MNRLLEKLVDDAGIDIREDNEISLEDFAYRVVVECCEFIEEHSEGSCILASDVAEHFGLIYKGE